MSWEFTGWRWRSWRCYHDCFARRRLRNSTGQSSCGKEKPEPPQLKLFRFLHAPENPFCCQPLLMLQSACASATTHSWSHRVLKSLSADHRGQNVSWHHCWKLSLQVCDIPSRQQRADVAQVSLEGLCWHSQASPISVPGLAGGGLCSLALLGTNWEYGTRSGLPHVIRFAEPRWKQRKGDGTVGPGSFCRGKCHTAMNIQALPAAGDDPHAR